MTFISRSVAALCLLTSAALAFAQADYTNRPIKIIVPYSAGGGSAQVTGLSGQGRSAGAKQAIEVEHRRGVCTPLCTRHVAETEPTR